MAGSLIAIFRTDYCYSIIEWLQTALTYHSISLAPWILWFTDLPLNSFSNQSKQRKQMKYPMIIVANILPQNTYCALKKPIMSSALISLTPHSRSSLIHRAISFCNLDYLHRQTLIFHSDLAESSVDPILAVAKILANSLVVEFKDPKLTVPPLEVREFTIWSYSGTVSISTIRAMMINPSFNGKSWLARILNEGMEWGPVHAWVILTYLNYYRKVASSSTQGIVLFAATIR